MSSTKPSVHRPTATGSPTVATTALLLGALLVAALLGYGLVLDAPGLAPLGLLVYAPLFVMTLVAAAAERRGGPVGPWAGALLPLAVGAVTVTLLVGTFVIPDATAWWVVGAVVSALPFWFLAKAWQGHDRLHQP